MARAISLGECGRGAGLMDSIEATKPKKAEPTKAPTGNFSKDRESKPAVKKPRMVGWRLRHC